MNIYNLLYEIIQQFWQHVKSIRRIIYPGYYLGQPLFMPLIDF